MLTWDKTCCRTWNQHVESKLYTKCYKNSNKYCSFSFVGILGPFGQNHNKSSQYWSEKMPCYFHGEFCFWLIFWPKKPNAESEILSGYFSQNIPSDDFRFGFKSNWHGQNWKFINFAKAQSILKANFLVLIWTMEKSIRLVFLFNWEQEICFMN